MWLIKINMNWIFYALIAIGLMGVSDLFRKLASNLKDPIFSNFIFQLGAMTISTILFIYSRKVVNNPRDIAFGLIGGMLIGLFTTFSFKALNIGPGVSVVMPALRIGGVTLVAILGIILLKEKLTLQSVFGFLFSTVGIYLLFSNK